MNICPSWKSSTNLNLFSRWFGVGDGVVVEAGGHVQVGPS